MPIPITGRIPASGELPAALLADFSDIPTSGRRIDGVVIRKPDGSHVIFVNQDLSKRDSAFAVAKGRAVQDLGVIKDPAKPVWTIMRNDGRPTAAKIENRAAKILIRTPDLRTAFDGLVIPIASSIADRLDVSLSAVRLRLRQLDLLYRCIDADPAFR